MWIQLVEWTESNTYLAFLSLSFPSFSALILLFKPFFHLLSFLFITPFFLFLFYAYLTHPFSPFPLFLFFFILSIRLWYLLTQSFLVFILSYSSFLFLYILPLLACSSFLFPLFYALFFDFVFLFFLSKFSFSFYVPFIFLSFLFSLFFPFYFIFFLPIKNYQLRSMVNLIRELIYYFH